MNMEHYTEEQLQELEKLAQVATPGPWVAEESDGFNITREGRLLWKPGIQARRDIVFIAAARTAVPALVAAVRELERLSDAHVLNLNDQYKNLREVRERAARAEAGVGLLGQEAHTERIARLAAEAERDQLVAMLAKVCDFLTDDMIAPRIDALRAARALLARLARVKP